MSGPSSTSVQPGDGISQSFLDNVQSVQDKDEAIYLGLQIAGGHILLPILVMTVIFSSRAKRHPIFINFCLSWIFSSVVYSLLIYRGRSNSDDLSLDPSYNECLVQAALINGAQALTACATLSFILHFWFVIRSTLRSLRGVEKVGERWGLLYTSLLIGLPFVFFSAWTLISVIIGSQIAIDLNSDQDLPGSNLSVPSVFYCVIIVNGDFNGSIVPGMKIVRAVYIFSAVVSLLTLFIEVDVARRLFQSRRNFNSVSTLRMADNSVMFSRVVLFSVYRVFSLCLTLAVVVHPDELLIVGLANSFLYNGIIDFVQASLPLVVFLVFGTEKKILRAWCFWRKDSITDMNTAGERSSSESTDMKSVSV